MKTLAEFTAFYSAQHIARINREIEHYTKKNHLAYVKILQEQELPRWSPERVKDIAEKYYTALVNKDYPYLQRWTYYDGNKSLWKTINYTLGIKTPTTDGKLREWIMDYCGREEALAFHEQHRLAKIEKEKQDAITKTAAIITSLERDAETLKYSNGYSIKQEAIDLYEKGFRLIRRKQGFSEVRQIANEARGEYLINKRGRGFQHQVFYRTRLDYFEHYQSQQEKINPPPTEEEEEITPEIARLFNLPSSAITTTESREAQPFTRPSTITDRFPLLKKFATAH